MPNTFCHIAAQLPASRLLWAGADSRLILAGCIIPDLPWTIRHINTAVPFVDSYQLQLYTIAQASFFLCCLLALAIALCTARFLFTFTLVAANCLAHLLLDACQIKWANGVHLFAPFSWRAVRFDLSWPEHWLWFVLSAAGLIALLVVWWQNRNQPWPRLYQGKARRARFIGAALCLLLYFIAPLAFTGQIEREDNGFLATVHEQSARPGKYAEFDRRPYQGGFLTLFNGERIRLIGQVPDWTGQLSVRGRFVNPETLSVIELRRQSPWRDWASISALALVALMFLHSLPWRKIARQRPSFLSTETIA